MTATMTLALIWRPYFPAIPTLMGVAVLLGLAVFVCARSFRSHPLLSVLTLSMRSILIAASGLLLLGPSAVGPADARPDKPTLAVLVDTSASMQTRDADGLSRFAFAAERWLSPPRLASLREAYKVELYAFDESPRAIGRGTLRRPAESAATAGVSNIAKSVSDTVSRISAGPGSAVLVISDGRDTLDEPMHPVGQLARARSVPIYTVALGGPSLVRDLALVAVPRQPYLFAAEPGRIAVSVVQSNAGRSRTLLHVSQGDTHDTYPIAFDGRDSVTVDVPIAQDRPGNYEYRVWADPIPGEVERANNAQPVFVEVTAKRLRVLILEGRPYWDTKFLAQSLRKDSRIELTQITQVSKDKREAIVTRQGAKADVPRTLDDLAHYDVVILGRGIENILDAAMASLLPRYVFEHGGRLVLSRGRAYDPGTPAGREFAEALSVIEPVVYGEGVLHNQRIELEPAGMIHPSFNLAAGPATAGRIAGPTDTTPTLLNLPVVIREKAATKVLARTRPVGSVGRSGSGQPVIVTMPYGRGVVAAVLGEGLWRWSLRPRRTRETGGSFDRFWSDMVRWLALGSDYQPGRPVSLSLSRRGVRVGDPVSVDLVSRIGFDELDARVYVEGPDGKRSEPAVEPIGGSTTRRRAVLIPNAPGVYRVVVQTPLSPGRPIEARFNCYGVDLERLQSAANPGALRMLSEQSGGRCLSPYEPDALPRLLSRYRASIAVPPKPYYIWDHGWVMTLLLSLAGGEWLIRRMGGLL
jgi:hypothetical protein